jgi:hypothetical protein
MGKDMWTNRKMTPGPTGKRHAGEPGKDIWEDRKKCHMDKQDSDTWKDGKVTHGLMLARHMAVLFETRAARHVTCQRGQHVACQRILATSHAIMDWDT